MRRLVSALALSLALVPTVHARSLELALNDDMAQFLYSTSTDPWGMRGGEFGIGVLFNENDDLVGTLRLLSTNRVSPSFRLGVGLQGYAGDLDEIDETMGAVAIGGNIGFSLAAQVPVSLVFEGWIAPGILAFGDIDKLKEMSARIEVGVSDHAAVFVGYRKLKVDLSDYRHDYELDDSAQLGIRIGF
ncbi:MAG TPA: YfaZ family outer membrane protein [Gammaproteobacteria bacterium]|nr:YfaZ family outer membrane protein [Gammaproteobacteria bacterium]